MASAFTLDEHRQVAAIARQVLEAGRSGEADTRLEALRLAVRSSSDVASDADIVGRATAFADFVLGTISPQADHG